MGVKSIITPTPSLKGPIMSATIKTSFTSNNGRYLLTKNENEDSCITLSIFDCESGESTYKISHDRNYIQTLIDNCLNSDAHDPSEGNEDSYLDTFMEERMGCYADDYDCEY